MLFADAHVHLSDEAFHQDITDVLERTKQAGVSLVVNVATTREELDRSLRYAQEHPDLCFLHAAGTPPQDACDPSAFEESFAYFREMAHSRTLSAVGEVGLDYLFAKTEQEKEQQHMILREYLQLSLETELPLVIHCRQAFQDFFRILDRYYCHDERARPGMLHCFTGTLEEARELLVRGWYVSISGIVTFKNAEFLREIVAEVPIERLLVETDAPYLAPVPNRGKRNEPAFIMHTLEKIAQIKGLSLEALAHQVRENLLSYTSSRFLS